MILDDTNVPVENTETVAQEAPIAETPAPAEKPQETLKEYNMRMLREKNEASERRIKELELQAAQRQYEAPRPQQASQPAEFNLGLEDNDIVEVRHIKQLLADRDKKYEERLQSIQRQAEESAAESRLKIQHADFNSVVTPENIKTLAAIYPEAYNLLSSTRDIYSQGKTAYDMIKNFGILDVQHESQSIDRRVEQNKMKPRAAATVAPQTSDSPLSRVNDYDRRVLSDSDRERKMREVEMYKRARQ